jgi:hypothetical protein
MLQTDVKAGACAANASTTVFAGRVRLKSIIVTTPIGGGTLTITDGASGATVFSLVGQAAVGTTNILLPGEGILCATSLYVTCPAGLSATVCYG